MGEYVYVLTPTSGSLRRHLVRMHMTTPGNTLFRVIDKARHFFVHSRFLFRAEAVDKRKNKVGKRAARSTARCLPALLVSVLCTVIDGGIDQLS